MKDTTIMFVKGIIFTILGLLMAYLVDDPNDESYFVVLVQITAFVFVTFGVVGIVKFIFK